MKRRPPHKPARAPLLEELEPRILLSADLDPSGVLADASAAAGGGDLWDAAQVELLAAGDPGDAAAAVARLELAFVDGGIADHWELVEDLLRSPRPDGVRLEVVVLDPNRDGIEQISGVLGLHQDVDAVHVFSHGDAGILQLGSTRLSLATLEGRAASLSGWADALSADADLLLYGCDLAASESGKDLVESLARLTGSDVAASTDLSGSALLGGDWELEHRTGEIEAAGALGDGAQTWSGTLQTVHVAQESANNEAEIRSDQSWGQTFQHTSGDGTYTVDGLGLQLRKDSAVGPQNLTISLRQSWAGPDLASAVIAANSLSTTMQWQDIDLGAVTLNDGQTYYIQVTSDMSTGKVYIAHDDAGPYPDGDRIDTSGAAIPAEDLAFRVMSGDRAYVQSAESWAPTVSGAWEVKDLSGGTFNVPANAVLEIAISNGADGATQAGGVSATSSSLDRFLALHDSDSDSRDYAVMHVQADAASQIRTYASSADIQFTLLGYWTQGSYVETFATFSATQDATWEGLSLSASGVSANDVAEVVIANTNGLLGRMAGVRSSGSSVVRSVDLHDANGGVPDYDTTTMFVQADGSAGAGIEVYAEVAADVDFTVVGYWSTPPGTYTETMYDIGQPAADGTWGDIDLSAFGVPADAVGEFVLANDQGGGSDNEMGVRANSGALLPRTLDLNDRSPSGDGAPDLGRMHAAVDGSSTVEIFHTDVSDAFSFYLTGYWEFSATNNAPVLTPGAPAFSAITEDDTANIGSTVGGLLGGSVTDPDPGSPDGVAVTSLVSGNGTWEYSIDGGATWLAVGTVSDSQALLLRNPDRLRFVPDGENADAASVTYRAWDRTIGSEGTKLDVGTPGGSSAFSTATDTASITVTAVNDAPVLTPAAATVTITEDDLSGSGDLVSALLGASVTDVDTGALGGIALTGLSSGNGTWQYSIDGGTVWNAVGTVSDAQALLLRSSDRLRFVPDGENADAATVTYRAWDRSAGGTQGTKVAVGTPGGTSAFSTATDTASITVTALNDAPVLTPAAPSLTGITEDDTANVGDLVSALLGASVADVDTGAIEGIAVTGLASGNGSWEYSIDDGFSWSAVGAVSDAQALLLRANDRLRFVPDGENADTASVTYRAWDRSNSGTEGTKVNVGTPGATSAFSTATDTASLTVSSLNDAPVLTAAAPSFTAITEDDIANAGDLVSALLGASVTDVDSSAIEGIAVTGLVSDNGTWESSTDDGATWQAVGTVSDAQALLLRANDRLRFVPDGENADTASVTYRAWDRSNSGTEGTKVNVGTPGATSAFSTATDTASLTVSSLNDAPVLTAAAPSFTAITEDDIANAGDLVSALLGASVTDVDSSAIEGIAVTGLVSGNGTWESSTDDGATWQAVGTVSDAQALLLRANDRLRFVPDGENADTASVTYRAWDQSDAGTEGTKVNVGAPGGTSAFSTATDTASLTVTALNDAPVLTPAAPIFTGITEDDTANVGDLVSTLLGASVTDVDPGAIEGIAVTGLGSGNGTWESSTDGGATWQAVGTVSDAQALLLRANDRLRFVPDGQNADTASATYRAWDRTDGSTQGTKVNVGTPGGTSAFSSATDTASIAVSAVNDAPVLTPISPTATPITEDDTNGAGEPVWAWLGGSVSDVDSGAAEGIAITGLVSGNGTWQSSTDGATTWQAVGTVSDAQALLLRSTDRVRFVPDGENADTASVTYRAWDRSDGGTEGTKVNVGTPGGTSAFSTATDTASLTVSAVNDAPVLTPVSPTCTPITEDDTNGAGEPVWAWLGGSVSDVDPGAAEGIAVTGLVSGNGTWQYSTDGAATWQVIGTVSDTQALLLRSTDRVRFVPDGENADIASVTYRAWDRSDASTEGTKVNVGTPGGTSAFSSATDTASLTVSAVNDAPVLTPGAAGFTTIGEDDTANAGDSVAALLGASVTDVDSAALAGIAVTGLASGNGAWEYSIDGGASWSTVGSVSGANALLLRTSDRLRFVPDAENADSASVSYRAWDRSDGGTEGTRGNVGTPGSTSAFSSASDTASITVTAVNDAPQLGDGQLAAVQQGILDPAGASVSALFAGQLSDVDAGASLAGIAVIGSSANPVTEGVWEYSSDGGTSWFALAPAADGANALAVSAATRIRFVPAPGFSGTPTALAVRALDDSYAGGFSSTAPASETRITVDTTLRGGTSAIAAAPSALATSVTPLPAVPSAAPPGEPAPTLVDPIAAPEEADAPTLDLAIGDEAPPPDVAAAPPPETDRLAPRLPEISEPDLLATARATVLDVATGSTRSSSHQVESSLADLLRARMASDTSWSLPGQGSELERELDRMRDEVDEPGRLAELLVDSSVGVTLGLSVGYVIWLTRGGLLIASLLSSMPAWRMVDPTPVLARALAGAADEEGDTESLESLVRDGAAAEPPEPYASDDARERLDDPAGDEA